MGGMEKENHNWIQGDRFHYLAHDCTFVGFHAGRLWFSYAHHGLRRESSCTVGQSKEWVRISNQQKKVSTT